MYYNLFLDDQRSPKNVTWVNLPPVQWVVVRNYTEFVKTITENGLPERISFDHDLAEQHYSLVGRTIEEYRQLESTFTEKTGYDCAKWLVRYCALNKLPIPHYTVHSMNPIGKNNIISLLESYKKSLTS